ncbi:IS3 family transposase [Paenibacillus sophorae]|uniref:IS3 family transposase n=1 Tax=Paenibacillus sophorae TaxID=1333845 RepID=A0ABX8HFB0_9BACL|nr:IS3 family transposase [Paenibacillus sophorae]
MAWVLRILGLSESTYYDRKKRGVCPATTRQAESQLGRPVPGHSFTVTGERVCDEQIKEWLLELLEGEEHVYGYKLLAQCIRNRYNVKLNKKKAYRLCKELGILQQSRKRSLHIHAGSLKTGLSPGPTSCGKWTLSTAISSARNVSFLYLASLMCLTVSWSSSTEDPYVRPSMRSKPYGGRYRVVSNPKKSCP